MKQSTNFKVFGRALNRETQQGIAGLLVEVLDEDGIVDDRLGSTITDQQGQFELIYARSDFQEQYLERKPDLYLRVKDAHGKVLLSTEDAVRYEAGHTEAFILQIPNDPSQPETVPVTISIHGPDGLLYPKDTKVSLQSQKNTVLLKPGRQAGIYVGGVVPGAYTLTVAAGDLQTPEREVLVGAAGKVASAYLGKQDWPYYRMGEHVVPFEPREDLLAVAFPMAAPDHTTTLRSVKQLTKQLPLEPYRIHKDNELPFAAAEGAIWLFHLKEDYGSELIARIKRVVADYLGEETRVGLPVDLHPGQVKVLSDRYVVRFKAHLKPNEIETLVNRAKGRILRTFLQAENARLVEFDGGTYTTHLQTIEEWYKKELLIYGEPDLLAELTDDVFPADPPDDPTFVNQDNLTLQNADNAWQYLNGISANLTLGSPNVYVATLDRGVDTDHSDIGGNLTDGTPQLAQCYDFSGLRPCTAPGYAPDTSHGMGVYGIISALTNNTNDIAGIASNVHHIGMERPNLLSVNYPDVLLWAAGFTTGNSSVGWPAEPIAPAADIISCSHGSSGTPLSGIMDDTFQFLSSYGRGGRGTIVVYSAGNASTAITGFRTWAAHPRTLAISNSLQPNGAGVEVLDGSSNFGPEIDICAQGTNAPSLNDSGGEQTFGDTSAAAPTVAAAAALMLSAEPNLTWINVRDLLRTTAVTIDPANTDPVGQWIGGFSQWYGFGRLDIHAAVQAADDFDPGSTNLVIRDNLADTGTTVPSAGTFWLSPDLWVRTTNPAADPDPGYLVNPPHQTAQFGVDNWVRVRVKNTGFAASSNFYVRAYLTHFAGSEFQYPTDYIPSINSGDPIPSPLVQGTYLIGEVLVNSLAAGASDIYDFLWPAALVPPETVGGTSWHPCLLSEVSPHTGPTPTGVLVIDNSNLGQRNISINYPDDDSAEMTGVIGHAQQVELYRYVKLWRGNLPKKSKIWIRFLDARVERAVTQWLQSDSNKDCCCRRCCCGASGNRSPIVSSGQLVLQQRRGQRIFQLAQGDRLELTVPMVGDRLTPVVIGAELPPHRKAGVYTVSLTEHTASGKPLGGFSLQITQ